MKELVASFAVQLKEAIAIGDSANLTPSNNRIDNILITGLGGSGIGGTIVSEIIANESGLPVLVNKDYSLPAFVNEKGSNVRNAQRCAHATTTGRARPPRRG